MVEDTLFVINSLSGGGAERAMINIIAASRPYLNGRNLTLLLLDDDERAYNVPDWVRVIQLNCRHKFLASVRGVRHVVRKERPAVILSFLTRANIAVAAARGIAPFRWVASERVNTTAHLASARLAFVSKAMVRWAYPKADLIMPVSSGVGEDLVANFGVSRSRIHVVNNPIDVDTLRAAALRQTEIPLPVRFIVGVGRLVENKNFALLIDAFAAANYPGDLLILGDGPQRFALEKRIAALGLGRRVHLPGFVENPYPIIAAADSLVLSSNAEGIPNVILEAMAVGVPVVSTNCASGPAEILARRRTSDFTTIADVPGGVLVPPGDARALAKSIEMICDPERRSRAQEYGQERIKDFAEDSIMTRIWEGLDCPKYRSNNI